MVLFCSPRALQLSLLFGLLGLAQAIPYPRMVQKRDIFGDIGNFFDNLGMEVDMTIFQPIANFFTTTADAAVGFFGMEANAFFMQANTIFETAEYNIDMFVSDIGHAIDSAVIDEVNTVSKFASQVGQEIATGTQNVAGQIGDEFNNVIGPALINSLDVAGGDILTGLTAAGNYIEAHPELIAEICLTVALLALTTVQPELVGADAALLGEIATEVAAETAVEVAVDVGTTAGEAAVEGASEGLIEAASEPLATSIESGLGDLGPDYANFRAILDLASENGLSTIEELGPIEESTLQEIEASIGELEPIYANIPSEFFSSTEPIYANFQEVLHILQEAGLVIGGAAKRDAATIEARTTKVSTSSHKTSTITKAKSTSTKKSTTTTSKATPTATTPKKSTTTAPVSKTTSKPTTATYTPKTIPSSTVKKWLQYHWLSRTSTSTQGGKQYVSALLKWKMHGALTSTALTRPSIKSSIPTALQSAKLASIAYPPSAASYKHALSHQIATGKAVPYNGKGQLVKIVMDANAPVDPCLGLPKLNCFGNQLGQPYCRFSCASRWYNQRNVQVVHY